MNPHEKKPAGSDMSLAAVCGLYCGACTIYIGTTDDPARLKKLAERFGCPVEDLKCLGCRSEKRSPLCGARCTFTGCAAGRGVDFCSECADYPCNELKQFQAAMPHRIDLWRDLERIKAVGGARWLKEAQKKFCCPDCGTVNSAYDIKCRKCGAEPSCDYVGRNLEEVKKIAGMK